ncbi:DNA polymerase [Ralstonia sp.]|uniref:DNA polymerase n=1 Tax=Ralstonia sp. TaxID=54061 RepID=UPI0031D991C2
MTTVFSFIKDYAERGRDRYFLWRGGEGKEVSSKDIVDFQEMLVCHDYWLIAPSLYKTEGCLPPTVIDVEDFRFAIRGEKVDRRVRERRTIADSLSEIPEAESLGDYMDMFYGRISADEKVILSIASTISEYWNRLKDEAEASGELERYLDVEVGVFNYLTMCAATGIRVDKEKLRSHKESIDHDYYMALKKFAVKYNLPFEVPDDVEVQRYLEPRGFDFSGVSVDYILNFVPMQDDFADDLLALRRLEGSRSVLLAIPFSKSKVCPIVDIFGSITSRIYYRDPALQGLAKRHRDIIIPDDGFVLSYVDYDQFEVGVMAALSNDPELLRLYRLADMYEEVANIIFSDPSKRKEAKKIFLSYAYGMNKKRLLDAAYSHGASRSVVREFLARFVVYEDWKKAVWEAYETDQRIGTSMGNFLRRKSTGQLSEKESRSCVSQVVQGTASLIFKKAILRIKDIKQVQLKIPMHDAVLVQHRPDFDTQLIVRAFSDAMTDHFRSKIIGKASLDNFFETRA